MYSGLGVGCSCVFILHLVNWLCYQWHPVTDSVHRVPCESPVSHRQLAWDVTENPENLGFCFPSRRTCLSGAQVLPQGSWPPSDTMWRSAQESKASKHGHILAMLELLERMLPSRVWCDRDGSMSCPKGQAVRSQGAALLEAWTWAERPSGHLPQPVHSQRCCGNTHTTSSSSISEGTRRIERRKEVTVLRFLSKAQRFVTSCFLLKGCSPEKCNLLPHIQKMAVWITA